MKIKVTLSRIILIALAGAMLAPGWVQAAELTERKATIGSSAASASTSYAFSFKSGTATTIRAVKFQLCTSPINGACTQPNAATFAGAGGPTIGGELTGVWTPSISTNTVTISKAAGDTLTVGGTSTVTFTAVTNPNTANYQYYARITTYSDAGATTPVDYGGIALSTADQVVVSGTMPESLVFCVGTSGTNCGNITNATVDLGTFSPSTTSTGTSVMSASTNAGFGYAITINGTTMMSGANPITALATQTASATGTGQFGLNVTGSGSGSGAPHTNYSNGTQYRFNTGDVVATASGPTDANLFTSNYIVNVGGSQAAGVYTTTLTYICTATF
jgi:hypothetical protein